MADGRGGAVDPIALKPVGVTDDGSSVLLARRSNAKKGQFRLVIDDALLARLEEARDRAAAATHLADAPDEELPEDPEATVGPVAQAESKLSIKEIQTLLRQGRSVASVAKKAGVDPAWVERFESPIIWERSGMAARARRAVLSRARMGDSALPLGESVHANLKAKGVLMTDPEFEQSWDAVRYAHGTRWKVSFRFFYRGRDRDVRWDYEPLTDQLHPLDKTAADLGWVARRGRRASRS